MVLKLDEIICQSMWQMAYEDKMTDADSYASEHELNIIRSLRKFFEMSADRFNNSMNVYNNLTKEEKELMYKNLDPLTQLVTIWCCYCVAEVDREDENWISNEEWSWLSNNILNNSYFDDFELRQLIKDKCWRFIGRLTDSKLLYDSSYESQKIIEEKKNGLLNIMYTEIILNEVFNYFKVKKQYLKYKSAYLSLKRNYNELVGMFGKFDLEPFDAEYEDLNLLIIRAEADAVLAELKADTILAELEADSKLANNKPKLAHKNEPKEHKFKTSFGITFCVFCGEQSHYTDDECPRRSANHKFVVLKDGDELARFCNNCAGRFGYDDFSECVPEHKAHKFKSSKGRVFCKQCGDERGYAEKECDVKNAGHEIILTKANDKMCNKCGKLRGYDDLTTCK